MFTNDTEISTISWNRIIGWIFTILVPFISYYYFKNSSYAYQMLMVVGSSGLVMLIFNLIPPFIIGLFLILSIVMLGLAPMEIALSGFSSVSFMMAFSFLGLGVTLIHSGLIARFFYKILYYLPNTFLGQSIGVFLTGLTLTPLVPVVPGYSMRVNIILQLLQGLYKGREDSHYSASLITVGFSSVTSFVSVFLSSSTLNFIILGLLRTQDQISFQWLGWIHATFISGIVVFIGNVVAYWLVYGNQYIKFKTPFNYLSKYKEMGHITSREYVVLIAFSIFVIGTLTSSIHKIEPVWIGLLTLAILLFYHSISEENFRSQIPWDTMILLGSLSGAIAALNSAGMSSNLNTSLSWVQDYIQQSPYLLVTLILGITFVLRLMVPSSSIISIILASIFIPLSYSNGINSWLICFMIIVFADCWFFPFQSGEFAQLERLVSQKTKDKTNFLEFNSIVSIFKIASIYLSIIYWQKLGLI